MRRYLPPVSYPVSLSRARNYRSSSCPLVKGVESQLRKAFYKRYRISFTQRPLTQPCERFRVTRRTQ